MAGAQLTSDRGCSGVIQPTLRRPVEEGGGCPFCASSAPPEKMRGQSADRRWCGTPHPWPASRSSLSRDRPRPQRDRPLGRLSALCCGSRHRLSVLPQLRAALPPAIKPGFERAPRAGVIVPQGRVPKPPGSPADNRDPQAPHKSAWHSRRTNSGTAWLFSARASRPLHQAASPVDAPRRARRVQHGCRLRQGEGGNLPKI